MKSLICLNVSNHREIKGNYKYVTLDISLKSDRVDNIKVISSESKEKLRRLGKGLIISLGLKSRVRPHKYKNSRYAIGNVSKKDLSKIIGVFEKLTCESYENNRPKYDPTDSYFYLARHLVNGRMRADVLNSHVYPVRTEMNDPSYHICFTDKSELK